MTILNLSRDDDRAPLLNQAEQQHRDPLPVDAAIEQLDDDDQSAIVDEKGQALYESPARFWAVTLSYVVILFLFACNGTVITTTYGAIAESLHAYSTAATWLNASYMVRGPSSDSASMLRHRCR